MTARYKKNIVQGPFRTAENPLRDAKQARATLEVAGQTYQLLVTIHGSACPSAANVNEEGWQRAMGFLTLVELDQWLPDDLPKGAWPEFWIRLLEGSNPREWSGVGVEAYARSKLPEYDLSEAGFVWVARRIE